MRNLALHVRSSLHLRPYLPSILLQQVIYRTKSSELKEFASETQLFATEDILLFPGQEKRIEIKERAEGRKFKWMNSWMGSTNPSGEARVVWGGSIMLVRLQEAEIANADLPTILVVLCHHFRHKLSHSVSRMTTVWRSVCGNHCIPQDGWLLITDIFRTLHRNGAGISCGWLGIDQNGCSTVVTTASRKYTTILNTVAFSLSLQPCQNALHCWIWVIFNSGDNNALISCGSRNYFLIWMVTV